MQRPNRTSSNGTRPSHGLEQLEFLAAGCAMPKPLRRKDGEQCKGEGKRGDNRLNPRRCARVGLRPANQGQFDTITIGQLARKAPKDIQR